jgi:hypothetical protein
VYLHEILLELKILMMAFYLLLDPLDFFRRAQRFGYHLPLDAHHPQVLDFMSPIMRMSTVAVGLSTLPPIYHHRPRATRSHRHQSADQCTVLAFEH